MGLLCLDTMGANRGGQIGLYQCHGGGGNQVITLSKHAACIIYVITLKLYNGYSNVLYVLHSQIVYLFVRKVTIKCL